MNILLTLPWPPSANTYWRRNGNRYFISKKGYEYRTLVMLHCLPYKGFFKKEDRIELCVDAFPPDKRVRDLDNLFKSLLDSLQAGGVFHNDNQIDALSIIRLKELRGYVKVYLEKIE